MTGVVRNRRLSTVRTSTLSGTVHRSADVIHMQDAEKGRT